VEIYSKTREEFKILRTKKTQPMQAQEEAYDPCDTQTSVQKNTNDESM
jgi:hypothetical protein